MYWPYQKIAEEYGNTKLLGLQIDSHMNWINHINYMVPKLCDSCCVARYMFHTSNTDTSKSIHFAYFHSIIKYGTILGNSSGNKNI